MKKLKKPARFYTVYANSGGTLHRIGSIRHYKYTSAYAYVVKSISFDARIISCVIASNYGAAINITRTLLKRLNKIK